MSEITLAGYLEEKTAPIKALINEIVAERDALRRRNEKLEKAADRLFDIIGCFGYDGMPLVAVEREGKIVQFPVDRTLAKALARAGDALSDLDKEDA